MATNAAPYGLKPIKKSNGDPWTGAANTYRIQSNTSGVINYGGPVILASGYITVPAGANLGAGSPERFIGVFQGCSYTDPNTSQVVFKQSYPGSIVASDILAYVADDPELIFQIQMATATFDALAVVGAANCYALSSNSSAGNYGLSNIALSSTSPASNLPFRIMGIATLPDNTNASGYVDVLVKINGGFHVQTRAG